MELLEQIKKQTAEIAKKQQDLIEQLKPKFKELFMPFLEKYKGKVGYIYWTQYTPYFNDGEECTFSVGELCASIATNQEELEDEDCFPYEGDFPLYYSKYRKETIEDADIDERLIKHFGSKEAVIECGKAFEIIKQAIEDIPNDMMKAVLGDHITVCVTLDGVEVEQYDHD